MPIHVLSQDGRSISGSRDTLTGGGAVPIHVLSQDGQSIMGLQGGMVWFVHPGSTLGWSEYFGSYGQVWYNPYSILRISMLFDGVTGHPSIQNDKSLN